MTHLHKKVLCSCGSVIAQCRCFGPKDTEVVEKGCKKCKGISPPKKRAETTK